MPPMWLLRAPKKNLSMAPFAALGLDVLAHVLGFLVHVRWVLPMAGTNLGGVHCVSKVLSSPHALRS